MNLLIEIRPDIPIVLCGNKVDARDRQVTAREITFRRRNNMHYYEISAKSNYNLEKPFLYFARRLLGEPNLHFVESPAPLPPQVHIDTAAHDKNEAELAVAVSQALPDDDDDDEENAAFE
ncbi:unnamed protein product [Thlaspi arvense]|uniref:GTP-binding nuclear protein n=1 Tax=Thlaspi arvense TaxID=13288 RepID=A0AAU9SDQ3_THLAR|nr:unnamed protein product [Thlaspi arvense]